MKQHNSSDLLTICFIGFDGYSDLWNDCIDLFHLFWKDCPYRVIFINNSLPVSFQNVDVIHAGDDAEWSQKVRVALDSVSTPYICLLLEDFFLGKKIDTQLILKTMDFITKEKIRYYKLVNMNRATKNRDPLFKEQKFLHVIPQSDEYGISLQAAIWETGFLSFLLGEGNYNAWMFEFDRVKDANNKPNSPNPGCVFDDRNILNLQHAVIQSKYLPGTIRYFNKLGIRLNVQRDIMSYANYYKIRLISKGKYILPQSLRKTVKRGLEFLGMKFVSTVRNKP